MTILSDFSREMVIELDKLGRYDPARIRSKFPPDEWMKFVKMLTVIDSGTHPVLVETRLKLEHIALRNERFQERCKAMLPHLMRLLPMGSVQ